MEEGAETAKTRGSGGFKQNFVSTNVRIYTHQVSPTWMLPKNDLNTEDTNKHANMEGAGIGRQASK